MEEEEVDSLVDAMAAVASDHREAVGLCMFLDLGTDVPVPLTRLHWKVNTNNVEGNKTM